MEQNKGVSEKEVFLENHVPNYDIKVYGKRWLILGIYMYYTLLNSFQWIEYCTIKHTVVRYYGVSNLAVDWTSIIYMAFYPVFIIPVSMIIDKKGLRVAGLVGCLGTVIGTSIKVLSVRRDLFFVVLMGQGMLGLSQTIIVTLPPKIASTWFKPDEVSTACSMAVLGSILGMALGYVVPSMIVQYSEDLDDIGAGLKILCWTLTIAIIPAALAVLFYFPKEPPLPPSLAQAYIRETKKEFSTKKFFISVQKLFTNKAFNIFTVAYSINMATFTAFFTLSTQYILQFFPDAYVDAGFMGFVMILSGTIGSLFFGIFLDKTHKYKATTLFICLCSALSLLGLTYSLKWCSMLWTYIMSALVGIFSNAIVPVGVEFAMELTFPSEESTTAGILLSITQLLSMVLTMGIGHLNIWIGYYWTLISQVIFLFVGLGITACVPNVMLRQEAFKNLKNVNVLKKPSYQGSKLLVIK